MRWWWVAILGLLAGCAKRAPEEAAMEGYGRGGGGAGEPARKMSAMGAPQSPPPMPAAAEDMAYEEGLTARIEGNMAGGQIRGTGPAPPPPPRADARMVHYDGWARLLVTDPPETLDAIVAIAEEVGGRTERMSGTVVTVRVPTDAFEGAWERIRALGEVMDESVRADDVTDAFLDADLRVRVMEETQRRLVDLLAKAEEEEEKLRLLQEITRVTEQLDTLRTQLRTISELAAMARITVEAVPREAFTGGGEEPELAGFAWVRALSPFNRAVWSDDRRVKLETPDGFVALDDKGPYIAEAADGAALWTLRVENDPEGDAAFWTAAIADRIAEEFADPTSSSVGKWSCLTLDEPGAEEPYRWKVCVSDEGRWLHVAQAWFPSPESVARWSALVDGALTVGGES